MPRKSSSIQTIVFYSRRIRKIRRYNRQRLFVCTHTSAAAPPTPSPHRNLHPSPLCLVIIIKYPLILLILDYIVCMAHRAPHTAPGLHNVRWSLIFNSINPIKCALMREFYMHNLLFGAKHLSELNQKTEKNRQFRLCGDGCAARPNTLDSRVRMYGECFAHGTKVKENMSN